MVLNIKEAKSYVEAFHFSLALVCQYAPAAFSIRCLLKLEKLARFLTHRNTQRESDKLNFTCSVFISEERPAWVSKLALYEEEHMFNQGFFCQVAPPQTVFFFLSILTRSHLLYCDAAKYYREVS